MAGSPPILPCVNFVRPHPGQSLNGSRRSHSPRPAGQHAQHQAPMHVAACDAADAQALSHRLGGGACSSWLGRAASQRCLNQPMAGGRQQTADGLVHAAGLAQPNPPAQSTAHRPVHRHRKVRRCPAHWRAKAAHAAAQRRPNRPVPGALTADDDESGPRGQGHAQGREHQGCGALWGVLPGIPVAKRALEQQRPHLHGAHTRKPDKHAKQRQRGQQCQAGQGDVGKVFSSLGS